MKTKASTGEERGDLLAPLRLAIERASSEAQYAERRYMAVDPDDRVRSKKRQRPRSLIRGPDNGSADLRASWAIAPPFRDGRGERTVMDWTHILSYVTGTVDQELLARTSWRPLRALVV